MPAGVPWPTYLKTLAASLLAMLAGAEVVHRYYGPDLVSAAGGIGAGGGRAGGGTVRALRGLGTRSRVKIEAATKYKPRSSGRSERTRGVCVSELY